MNGINWQLHRTKLANDDLREFRARLTELGVDGGMHVVVSLDSPVAQCVQFIGCVAFPRLQFLDYLLMYLVNINEVAAPFFQSLLSSQESRIVGSSDCCTPRCLIAIGAIAEELVRNL